MADETTVQLSKDLAKQIRLLAVQRETTVKIEINNAVALYLQSEAPQTENGAQRVPAVQS